MNTLFDLTTIALIGLIVSPIGFGLLYAYLKLRRERRTQSAIRRVMEG